MKFTNVPKIDVLACADLADKEDMIDMLTTLGFSLEAALTTEQYSTILRELATVGKTTVPKGIDHSDVMENTRTSFALEDMTITDANWLKYKKM